MTTTDSTATVSPPVDVDGLLRSGRPLTAPAAQIDSADQAVAVARELATRWAVGAAARDRDRVLPWAELDEYSGSGLWSITVPRRFGGPEVPYRTLADVITTIAEADPSIAQITQNHFAGMSRLALIGHPDQQAFVFERVVAGERFGNASAEPGDVPPGSIGTTLRRDGGIYRIDGRKVFSTGALFAHWISVSTRDQEGRNRSAIVAAGSPGMHIVDDWSGFGQRTTASGTVVLRDVPVHPLLVADRQADPVTQDILGAIVHVIHSAIELGIGRAALADTVRFIRELAHPARGSGVVRAADDPITLYELGHLQVHHHSAEALVERSADRIDTALATRAPADAAAALLAVEEAKVITTTFALDAASKLFELAGTRSTLAEHGLDRHWRNARTHSLHDGVRWKYHAIGNHLLTGALPDPWSFGHPYRPAPARADEPHCDASRPPHHHRSTT